MSSSKSKSPQSKRRKSRSKSQQRKKSGEPSKSYQRNRRRTPSYQRRSPDRGSRRNPQLIPRSTKLFVTNIDSSLNQEQVKKDLQAQFSVFGQIKQVIIKTKRGSSNSYTFIEYIKEQDAQRALKQMKGKDFKGKQLKVQFGRGERKQQDRRSDKCYICHKEGHFAKDCRYRERSRQRRDSRDYGRRRRHSRSSSSSRSGRRRRSSDRQKDRDYRRRDYRQRQYRHSPDRRRQRQYRDERRQRY